jgi:hypothetical protein
MEGILILRELFESAKVRARRAIWIIRYQTTFTEANLHTRVIDSRAGKVPLVTTIRVSTSSVIPSPDARRGRSQQLKINRSQIQIRHYKHK